MSGMNISGLASSDSYSSLFDSLSTSSSSSSGSSSLLTDWASIKNGSYGKLTKAYYTKGSGSQSTIDTDEAKTLIKSNSLLKSDVSGLRSSISDIMNSESLFTNKVTGKDSDGNETSDYDRDKITKALKSFVSAYNSVVESGSESDNTTILRNTLAMTTLTSKNSNLLDSVGITIGENNKLSVNEETLKKADISELKSLFSGYGSYVSSIDANASNIINAVNVENNKLSNYTSAGAYAQTGSVGNIYDGSY